MYVSHTRIYVYGMCINMTYVPLYLCTLHTYEYLHVDQCLCRYLYFFQATDSPERAEEGVLDGRGYGNLVCGLTGTLSAKAEFLGKV